jgi:metal-sulfur cluster biosynthetic enzyme
MLSEKQVLTSLKEVKDPELGLDMVALGLIYRVTITDGKVHLRMTLTFPGCPWGPELVEKAKKAVRKIKGVESVEVELTFDPPWDLNKMNTESKLYLGIK